MSNYVELIDEVKIFETLATTLRNLMQSKKINEAELARKTNIPQPTLHKILAKKTIDPRASTLRSLASYFGIAIDELLTGSTYTQRNPISSIKPLAIISWKNCVNGGARTKELTPANWDNWL